MSQPIAAPKNAPLELKLQIMLRNWSYPEFREILYKEARSCRTYGCSNVYQRLYAYIRALELRKHGLIYNEIKRNISNEIGYIVPNSVLPCWLRGAHTPLGNISVFDVHCSEVGLIMGLVLSDGHRRQHYNRRGLVNNREVSFFNKEKDIIEEFREACSKLGLKVSDRSNLEGKCPKAETHSTLLYLLVKRYDDFIVKAPTNVQMSFLRGLMLGDGYIGIRIKLYNTNLKLIEVASKVLEIHGIKHSIQGPYRPNPPRRKLRYDIYIWKKAGGNFLKLIGLAESPPRPSIINLKISPIWLWLGLGLGGGGVVEGGRRGGVGARRG